MKPTTAAMLATFAVGMFLACGGSGNTPEHEEDSVSSTSAEYMVRVAVHDDTSNRPLNPQAEIWFRGRGSWWITPATKFGSATEDLAIREPNKKDTLHIYPDGREGRETIVAIMMTAEMNPNGSPHDAVTIAITDTEVTVSGLPVRAANGEFEQKFKR